MHKKFFALLDEAPVEGGNGNPPPPAGTPPPVATTIANPRRSEREVDLEAELQITRTEKEQIANRAKKLETDVAHLQDENQRLKNPAPTATPTDDRTELERFMDGE